MGQKVHPYGIRLGIIRPWLSRWYAEDDRYRDQTIEDVKIRRLIRQRLRNASVSQIAIERNADAVTLIVSTAKPGVVIGRSGSGVDRLNREIQKLIGRKVHITVEEVKRPELDAQLVADNIAHQIERRISFRRAVRQAVQRTMRSGAEGMKVRVGGRLGGAEIAHSETSEVRGRVPLHTFRADVDYGLAEAKTAQGHIGVKVWVYKGDIIPDRRRREFEQARERAETPGVAAGRRDEAGGEERAADEAAAGVEEEAPAVQEKTPVAEVEAAASQEEAAPPQGEVAVSGAAPAGAAGDAAPEEEDAPDPTEPEGEAPGATEETPEPSEPSQATGDADQGEQTDANA